MLEVSRITLVLLIEGVIVFASTTLLLVFFNIRRVKRRTRAVAQLAEQIRHQSSLRREQTGSYLEAIYQLEGEELQSAVRSIDSQEKQFFQQMINVLHNEDREGIATLDATLAELIDTYKNMRPRELVRVESDAVLLAETEALKDANEQLAVANEKLSDELQVTKETMSRMVAEFGNMFGGGADHELAKHEVVEKISDKDLADDAEESAA